MGRKIVGSFPFWFTQQGHRCLAFFQLCFCKWHRIARGCSAKLASSPASLPAQGSSSRWCLHLFLLSPASMGWQWANMGQTDLKTAHRSFHALWSNLQYVLGLYSFLNTAGNCSNLHPRDPQQLQEAIRPRRSLISCTHITWAGCLMHLAASPERAHCSKQDRIHPGAGQIREGPQQALLEVKAPAWHAECRHGLTCAGCCACKRWICSFFTWGQLVCRTACWGHLAFPCTLAVCKAFGLLRAWLAGQRHNRALNFGNTEGKSRKEGNQGEEKPSTECEGSVTQGCSSCPSPRLCPVYQVLCVFSRLLRSPSALDWASQTPCWQWQQAFFFFTSFVLQQFFLSMLCHISKDRLRHTLWHGFLPSSATRVSLRRGGNFPAPGAGQATHSPSTSPALHLLWKSQLVTDHVHCWRAWQEAFHLGTSCHHQLLSQQILRICHKAKSL